MCFLFLMVTDQPCDSGCRELPHHVRGFPLCSVWTCWCMYCERESVGDRRSKREEFLTVLHQTLLKQNCQRKAISPAINIFKKNVFGIVKIFSGWGRVLLGCFTPKLIKLLSA
ncbi:hypothetical protein GOODEAATRI_021944, partial [Goodea atripinnis]